MVPFSVWCSLKKKVLGGKKMWSKFSRMVVYHPILVLVLVGIITLALGLNAFPLNIRGVDFLEELSQNEEIVQDTRYIDETFGSQEIIIIGIENEDLFTVEGLSRVFVITDEISNIDGVIKSRINSIATAKEIKITEEGIMVAPLIERPPESPEDVVAIRDKILSNSSIYGELVSRDKTSTLIIVPLETGYNQKEIFNSFYRIRANFQDTDTVIHISGRAIAKESLEGGINSDLPFLLLLAFLAVIVVFILTLRRLLMVAVPLVVISLAVIWSFGAMNYLGIDMTLIGSAMPLIVIALGSSYGIHLILRYYDELRGGSEKKEAVILSLEKTGPAIFLAGITSALGFGTLYIFKILSIREFAVIAAIGILVAVFLSLTLAPAMLALFRAPSYLKKDEGMLKRAVDLFDLSVTRTLKVVIRFVFKYKYLVLFAALAAPIALASTGIPRVSTRLDIESFFPKEHEIARTERFLASDFDWNARMQVLVDTKEEGAVNDPKKIAAIRQFQNDIGKLEGVSFTSSFFSVFDQLIKDASSRVSENPDELLTRLVKSGYFASYVTQDGRMFKIDVRMKSADMSIVSAVEKETRKLGARHFGNEYGLQYSGEELLLSSINGYIVTGKMQNMILSVIVVGLFCAFVFRIKKLGLGRNVLGSFGFGVLSVLPLVVSTLAIFGLMGWLGISFNMITAVISGIAVGVGVDFAIHYLHRVRELNNYIGERISYTELEKATVLAGRPIVFDVLSNIAGFSVFLFSSFVPLNQLGFLMVLIMVTCSLGTILILPPLVSIFYDKKVSA